MADIEKIISWGTAAGDDVDVRAEEGARLLAERYASRKGISIEDAILAMQNETAAREKRAAKAATLKRAQG